MEQELILDEAQLKTCRCGYHKHDDRIIPRCRYSWFGMLRMLCYQKNTIQKQPSETLIIILEYH